MIKQREQRVTMIKTCTNTTYYDKTRTNGLLSTSARPHYGGFISSVGAINRNTGTFTYTVSKLGAGSYQILYDYSLSSATYAAMCNPRISTCALLLIQVEQLHL